MVKKSTFADSRLPRFSDKWEVCNLGDLVRFMRGKGLSKTKLSAQGRPCILYGELFTSHKEVIRQVTNKTIYKEGTPSVSGDILMPGSTTTVGIDLAIASALLLDDVLLGGDVNILRVKKDIYDSVFLAYYLRYEKKREIEKATQGITIIHLNSGKLANISLLVPPTKSEQNAIGKVLVDIDSWIESLRRLVQKKRDIKTAAMQELLTGKTRLPGFAGKWATKKLADIASLSSGGTPDTKTKAYYGGHIPWVSIADMTEQKMWISKTERMLTPLGLANSAARIYPKNTVLYAMYASIGECSIAKTEMASSQAILGIETEKANHLYLYYHLANGKETVKKQAQWGTQGNLNIEIVKNFNIPFPSLSEQAAIAGLLADMDANIATQERLLEKAKYVKIAVMQELLTGKTRLPATQ